MKVDKLVKLFSVIIVVSFALKVNAQRNAIGIRFSDDFGITYKYNLKNANWLEGIAHVGDHSLTLTGLYEIYKPTPFSKNFNWYYGGGIYVGFWGHRDNGGTYAGLRGVLGMCYKIPDIPIDISLDWMPTIQLASDFGTDFLIFGISIRYVF